MTEPRRSSRTSTPPQSYSPTFHYILLIDIGELESYNEAMQVDELIKRELAMRNEMGYYYPIRYDN